MGKKLVVAVFVLTVLISAAWWVGRKDESDARAQRAEARLLVFDDRNVTAMTVEMQGVAWRFERLADGWRITAPIRDAAHQNGATSLLASLRRSPVQRVIENPDALSTYGLDPPRARVSLTGVEAPRLDLGDATPTGDSLFASVEGRAGVLVIGLPEALPLLALAPGLLRDDSAIGVMPTEVRDLTVETSGSTIRLEKSVDGWWIVSPRRLPAAEGVVDGLLRGLDACKVAGFEDGLDSTEPALGLGPGATRFTLAAPTFRRTVTLGADAGDGSRFATRDDRQTVVRLTGEALRSVPSRVEAFQSRSLTRINRYQVRRFVYESAGRRIAAARGDDDRWSTDAGRAIPDEDVYALLAKLLGATVVGWDDDASTGDPPVGSLQIEVDGGASVSVSYLSGERARTSWVPGVTARIAAPPPPVP